MDRKFLVAWPLLFVVWMVGSFLVHGMLLGPEYAKLGAMFRPEADAQQYFPFMLLAHVIMAGAFAWVYAQGVKELPWVPQGARFGIAVALMTVVPTYLIYYTVQPMPGKLVAWQIALDGGLVIVLGLAVAFVYRSPADPGLT